MSGKLRKLAFVIEEFAAGKPAQQILDRFLLGYPRDGGFHRIEGCQCSVYVENAAANEDLARRKKDFGLEIAASMDDCLRDADAVVVAPREIAGRSSLVRSVVAKAATANCFVYGALANTRAEAEQIIARWGSRIASGTATAVAYRLPDVDLPNNSSAVRALIVVQGGSPDAEIEALQGLLPIIEKRKGAVSGIAAVKRFEGREVWPQIENGFTPLLESALSRSDTPQGDSVEDGRTQDLAGLGLVPKLATNPRAWLVEHRDGFQSMIAVLDGVIADYTFAVELRTRQIISAQLYRPPAAFGHQYSPLAAVMEDFFRTGIAPWQDERALFIAEFLERMNK